MSNIIYKDRVRRCCRLMRTANLDVLLLTKPPTCSTLPEMAVYAPMRMITQKGKVALGVPQTDVKDVKSLAYFNCLVGLKTR